MVAVLGELGGSLFVDRELAPGARVVDRGPRAAQDGDRVDAKLDGSASAEPTTGQALHSEGKP